MAVQLSGIIHEGEFTSAVYYPGTVFPYAVHIPACCTGRQDNALMVTHDGLNAEKALAAEQLAEAGEAPPCITVGVKPGRIGERNLRMNVYDMFTDRYPNFIVDELIPHLTAAYGLRISPSPDMHLTCGGSSGGISAWNMAWQRNDYFRRVYMSSPSFLAMGNGDEILALIRKCEPKPIRVFTEFSEHEPDDYFGSSFCAADAAERALRFAGYAMASRFYPGEGHCSRHRSVESSLEQLRFLWAEKTVTVGQPSPRVAAVLPPDSRWEPAESFPLKQAAEIYRTQFPDCLPPVFSSNRERIYIAAPHKGCIYTAYLDENGQPGGTYVHAVLHRLTDFARPGAYAICVDSTDRLYAATEVGIQAVRSNGNVDVILQNPTAAPVEQLEIGHDGCLYAKAGGAIYRRPLRDRQRADGTTAPCCVSYYD